MSACPGKIDAAFAAARQAPEPPGGKRGRLRVGIAGDFGEGLCTIVEEGKLSIGVYRIGGRFYAIRNVCPHQGAPLCRGRLMSTHAPGEVHQYQPALQGRVQRCPWHGWEFDVPSGKGLYDDRARVKTYRCEVDAEGVLWVEI
ncbi:MAG TPA: Rieske 2Fe-2S domain-containing protein [Chthoniobacteraceae bacterium]|nr:Rieske 2Fe-2S domain-containing protein [Chthoniobacteraceae bacterium]